MFKIAKTLPFLIVGYSGFTGDRQIPLDDRFVL